MSEKKLKAMFDNVSLSGLNRCDDEELQSLHHAVIMTIQIAQKSGGRLFKYQSALSDFLILQKRYKIQIMEEITARSSITHKKREGKNK
jgi:hypothetical protein